MLIYNNSQHYLNYPSNMTILIKAMNNGCNDKFHKDLLKIIPFLNSSTDMNAKTIYDLESHSSKDTILKSYKTTQIA